MLLEFPVKRVKRHGRASAGSAAAVGRAANLTSRSAVTPLALATLVDKTADHQSSGIRSRRRHFETIERVAPMSDTATSIEGHRSITALNDLGLDIESLIGQFGLTGKANTAHDCERRLGDNAAMADRKTESEEKRAFIARVKQARIARFEVNEMLTILGIVQGSYKHYEGRSPLPYRFIPKFVAATGVSYEWLLTGKGKGPAARELPKESPKRTRRGAKPKVA